MAKVIGIGETVFDILFKNNVPVNAVPGGSVYNCIISLGRCGVQAEFISEVGDDRIGNINNFSVIVKRKLPVFNTFACLIG